MSESSRYEPVIGLEVHAQLLTQTKMFCSCANRYGAEPNSLICPVCSGQPGALPVINRDAVSLGIRAALAIQAEISPVSIFARKNYFYPDLPKGYQISQYEKPFCTRGKLSIHLKDGRETTIRLTRIHFEEDAGKSMHSGAGTLVNLNRAGVPLIEIVSEPDMRTSHEAGQYLRKLHSILKFSGVCDGNMEQGNFRCDANISVRPKGEAKFGTKVELKNINSFKYVEKAIDHEISRQIQCLESGEKIIQETRGWDAARGVTESMRKKEQAHDYRYFPEPDLAPLRISAEWVESVRKSLPELPDAMIERFQSQYQLSAYDSGVLTSSKEIADYYEQTVSRSKSPKASANWVMNELLGRLNAAGIEIEKSPVASADLAELITKLEANEISGRMAKEVFEEMFQTSKGPTRIIQEKGLVQVSDVGQIETVVKKVIDANPGQVQEYRAGKTKLLGFFVGQVMKEMKGQGNPGVINECVKKLLG